MYVNSFTFNEQEETIWILLQGFYRKFGHFLQCRFLGFVGLQVILHVVTIKQALKKRKYIRLR
jgi:hypothetical protein